MVLNQRRQRQLGGGGDPDSGGGGNNNSGDETQQQHSSFFFLRHKVTLGLTALLIVALLEWRDIRNFEPQLLQLPTATTTALSSLGSLRERQQPQQQHPTTAVELLQMALPSDKYRIHKLDGFDGGVDFDGVLEPSETTIVASHFRVASNPPTDTYYAWVSHLLTVQDSMIIFTQSDLVERMKLLRSSWPARTVIVEMSLADLPISHLLQNNNNNNSSSSSSSTSASFWSDQLAKDPHRDEHKSYEFYWQWLSKSWFVKQAIDLNLFDSQFYYYTDIGLFKTKKYLDKKLVRNLDAVPDGSLLWMTRTIPNPPAVAVSPAIVDDDDHTYHLGDMAAGRTQAWTQFHDKFAQTLDAFVEAGLFVGNDDAVLQGTCQLYKDLCSYVLASDVDDSVRAGLRTVLHEKKKYKLYRGQSGYKKAGQGGKKLMRKHKITGRR